MKYREPILENESKMLYNALKQQNPNFFVAAKKDSNDTDSYQYFEGRPSEGIIYLTDNNNDDFFLHEAGHFLDLSKNGKRGVEGLNEKPKSNMQLIKDEIRANTEAINYLRSVGASEERIDRYKKKLLPYLNTYKYHYFMRDKLPFYSKLKDTIVTQWPEYTTDKYVAKLNEVYKNRYPRLKRKPKLMHPEYLIDE